MKYEVVLKIHEDDATGEWGLIPQNVIGSQNGFNSFWEPSGIFHDVFEHFQEENNKYFSGKYACTIWGEMFASGAGIAYSNIGIDSLKYRRGFSSRDFITDTIGILENYFYEDDGYLEYPIDKDLNCVPRQSYTNNYTLDSVIREYQYQLENHKSPRAKEIWLEGIKRAYTYGFKQADKIIRQDTSHAYTVLDSFLDTWNRVCKTPVRNLWIEDEYAYPLKAFKFKVNSSPKLKVKCILIDEVNNEYNFNLLEY